MGSPDLVGFRKRLDRHLEFYKVTAAGFSFVEKYIENSIVIIIEVLMLYTFNRNQIERDIKLYTAMVKAVCAEGDRDRLRELLGEMRANGCLPSRITRCHFIACLLILTVPL